MGQPLFPLLSPSLMTAVIHGFIIRSLLSLLLCLRVELPDIFGTQPTARLS